jgi:hypothetical protein
MMTENYAKAASAAEKSSRRGDEKAAPASEATAERETRLLAVVRGATRDLSALLGAADAG